MDVDLDRWRALLDRERDLADSMPPFLSVQDAQTRLQVARSTLARFKANGPQGSLGGSPPRAAREGERILDGGMGRHGADDVRKAFDSSVRELEARVAAAAHDSGRIEQRRQKAGEALANVRRLIDQCRTWAAEEGIVLPGDGARVVPPRGLPGARSVLVPNAPPGSFDVLGGSA